MEHGRRARRPLPSLRPGALRGRRQLVQAAPQRRLPRRPALPAAAPPETGDASAAASAAAGASGGGAFRNRRRLGGGSRKRPLHGASQSHGRAPGIHGRPGERCCFQSAPVLPTCAVLFPISTGAPYMGGAVFAPDPSGSVPVTAAGSASISSPLPRVPSRPGPHRTAARRSPEDPVPWPGPAVPSVGAPGTCIRRPARISMPCSCICPAHAQAAPPDYPLCQARTPRSIPVSTVKSEIRQSRAQSPQLPASDAATQGARQRRQLPCSTGTRQHGGASASCVTHGQQSGFVRHADPHMQDMLAAWTRCMSTPAARAACFPAAPEHTASMVCQCVRRAPGIHPSGSPGGATNCPISEADAESPQAPANEAATQGARQCRQPPVFHKNRQSAFIRHAHGRPCVSRPTSEHPIHAVSGRSPGPVERPANSRPLHDEPRKIPNLQIPC